MSTLPVFVNCPLSAVAADEKLLALFFRARVHPELGIDHRACEGLSMTWHRDMAGRLQDEGLQCAVHLPFMDLHPGALDPLVLEASRQRLARALDVAAIYAPAHLVAHPMYSDVLYRGRFEQWLEASIGTWQGVLEALDGLAPLMLENTYETDPVPLVELLAHLPAEGAGWCFDVGHWFSFSRGSSRQNLESWFDALASRLGHLHLHDNDGREDQHLGLGQGSIPWEDLFAQLALRKASPSMTLEPHTEVGYAQSRAFMHRHPQWFGQA